ncbi:protocadherin-8-like [Chanos chanos]|uniref:Protocadherin-8-like n=1 Tax=Chanos chanos TaxID=29144 RepID=A0A6J2VSA4_CHACN|nr:protocadherin-8-like [Chanos chanos]
MPSQARDSKRVVELIESGFYKETDDYGYVRDMAMSLSLVLLFAVCTVRGTTTKYYTYEEDPLGKFIGNLSLDLKINLTEDPNTSFRFMQERNSSQIQMRRNDGVLTVGERIDRENLCQRSQRCVITFDVVVFSKEKFHLIHVEIYVKDINDHSPQFPHNETYLQISEAVAVGTRFPLDYAVDQDVGNNYIQSYQLFHNSHFGIEVRSGEDGIKVPQLVLVKELDREVEDSYLLQVTASDGGSPPKSGSFMVHVKILDSNDNSPQFEHNSLKVELHEDAPVGSLLLKVQAFDPDHGANGEVRYDFTEDSLNEVKDTFQIDPITGTVTLRSLVDFESRRSYELNIQAYDLGVNSIPSTCKVIAEIVDVNDNAPEITIKPMTSLSDGIAYITEAAAVESFVALISTSDRDSGANGYVRVSLQGHEHFKLQQAYGDTFMIVTTTTLDREKIPEYNLTVVAEDLGSPPFRTLLQYTVRVLDENDNAPLFSKSVYDIAVMENKAPGSYIATLIARDPDVGVNGKVTYTLIDENVGGAPISSLVSVNPVSGILYTMRSLDYESVKQIDVGILATDGGSPQLSSTAVVRIKVVDENDNAPFITYPVLLNDSAKVPIPHNAPAGYLALRVKARDMDDGINGELSYSIIEDKKTLFSINKNTGEIALKYGLTLQYGDAAEITVAVSDSGRTPLSCAARFSFVVTEMEPEEEQVVVVLESTEEEEISDFDASLIVIVLLSVGCALLLVAIVAVALSRKYSPRNETFGSKRRGPDGLFTKTPLPSHSIDSSESGSYKGGSTTVTEHILSSRDESSYSFEESSGDSDTKVFRPLLCEGNFEPVAIWQGDRFTLQTSNIRSTDQTSVKDSGKGDSDFNDSDSDISRDMGRKISTSIQPQTNCPFSAGLTAGHGRTREISTHTSSAPVSTGSYTIAYSRTSAYGHAHTNRPLPTWRDNAHNTILPRASEQPRAPICQRTGTLPSHYYYQQYAPFYQSQPATKDLREMASQHQNITSF